MGRLLRNAFVALRQYVNCVRLLGAKGLVLVLKTLLGFRGESLVYVGGQRLHLRINTTDLATLLQMFWNREYEFELAVAPRVIVDAGANVGYASLYFAARYPDARIFAIEPEAMNFKQLQKNTVDNAQIVPIHAALWNQDATLAVVDVGEGSWGFRVRAQKEREPGIGVRGITMASLMAEYRLDRVDILKLDVEGAEKEIFEDSAAWIDSVGVVVAELHDKYRIGCSRAFYNATNGFAHESRLGENILVLREPYLPRT